MTAETILITCTTPGREKVMDRCRFYVGRFTEPHTHIVINSANDYTTNLYRALLDLPASWDALFIIEDDDWYSPRWLTMGLAGLRVHDAIGQNPVRYYSPGTRTAHVFPTQGHSSLCSTAIRPTALRSLLAAIDAQGAKWADMNMWASLRANAGLSAAVGDFRAVVGMKGLTGNPCGYGHDQALPMADPDGSILRSWLGDEDAAYYSRDTLDAPIAAPMITP